MLTLLTTLAFIGQPAPLSDHNKAAIAFVRGHQTPSGGFATLMPAKGMEAVPSIRTTRTGLRALRLLGGEPANPDAVLRFVKACHDPKTGGFADRPGLAPDPISTSVALMILSDLKLPTDNYLAPALKFMGETTKNFEQIRMVAPGLEQLKVTVPQAADWLKIIDQARNADGSYGKGPGQTRSTGLYVVAQQRLGGKPESNDVVLKILRAGQRPDGGFGGEQAGPSDLEACYRIVRLFSRLNAQPDHPDKLRTFIASCRNADGGYAPQAKAASTLHGTYYATIVTHWLQGGK